MRKFVGIRQFVILVLFFTCLGLSRKYCIHTCDCMLWDRRVVPIHLQLETERDHLILILPTDPFGIAMFFCLLILSCYFTSCNIQDSLKNFWLLQPSLRKHSGAVISIKEEVGNPTDEPSLAGNPRKSSGKRGKTPQSFASRFLQFIIGVF